jgi:hypothetical protein
MLIGPCRLQRPRTTTRNETGQRGPRDQRNHQGGGARAQDLFSRCKGSQPFFQERQVTRNRVQPPSPLPPLQGSVGRDPLPPSTEHTPSPGKLPSRIGLGENLASTSKSGSEVTVRAQDDRMEHFWLNGISLRGRAAELETSAG